VRPADEGKQMMLAQRIKLDVLDQNDLARLRLEDGIVNNLFEVLPITLGEKFESTRCAVRRASQTFSIDIFTDALKQFAVGSPDSVEVFFSKAIALARESLFDVETGIAPLNH
jgi:hypothetical protein